MFGGKTNEIDMCHGAILPKVLLFALPLMLSSLLQLLFNAADIIVVGRFAGDTALAAVGATTTIVNMQTNLFIGLSVGSNVLVARYYGARKGRDLSDTVHTSVLVGVITGIFLMVIGILGAKQILTAMNTPADILPLSVIYLRLYFCGTIAVTLYNFGSAILRAVGDTKRPLYYLLAAGVINVVLNLIFVIALHMSVAGVALATVISQCVSAFLILRCLIRERGEIRLDPACLRISGSKVAMIFQIGIPASVQGIMFSISNLIIQASINGFGAVVVAGSAAAANIEGFVYVGMNAFALAVLSFVSQNLGAGDEKRAWRSHRICQACVLVTGLVLGLTVCYFGKTLLGLYSESPAVKEAGYTRLLMICSLYCLCGVMDVLVGALRGMGKSVAPMIVSVFGICGLRLFWLFTFFRMEAFHNVYCLYGTYPVTWIVTILMHFACYLYFKNHLQRGKERTPA